MYRNLQSFEIYAISCEELALVGVAPPTCNMHYQDKNTMRGEGVNLQSFEINAISWAIYCSTCFQVHLELFHVAPLMRIIQTKRQKQMTWLNVSMGTYMRKMEMCMMKVEHTFMDLEVSFLELAFQSQLSSLHQGSSTASIKRWKGFCGFHLRTSFITLHNPMPALMNSLNSCYYYPKWTVLIGQLVL